MTDQRELWDFALRLYAEPGVSAACLTLQDGSGVDVPLLLFAAWLAANDTPLPGDEIARIDGVVAEWREDVVKPLRSVRRRLKTGPHPSPTEQTELLRDGVKRVELQAEKIELNVLWGEGRALIDSARAAGGADSNLDRMLYYFRGSQPDPNADQALTVIKRALGTGPAV